MKAFKDRIDGLLGDGAPEVIKAITSNVEVGVGGGEALSGKTVLSYALFAYALPPGHFFQSKIEQLEGGAYVYAPAESIKRAVQELSNPDVEAPRKATDVATGRKPKAGAPPPRETTITVLNGNGVTGSASNAGYLLGQRGYVVITPPNGAPANAPSFDYFRSKVYFDPEQAGGKPAATKVANLFGDADVGPLPENVAPLANSALLAVVVGQTFRGNLAAAPVDQTPEKQEAEVAPGTSATVELLRARRNRVPFPLLVPTVIDRARGSTASGRCASTGSTRRAKHKAVRLTFRSGRGDYWASSRPTDGSAGPLERNFTRRIDGRRYELHYSGPKLHMVVLRRGKTTYWVVNTLLDSLSNETMLAIAKGLKPIPKVR